MCNHTWKQRQKQPIQQVFATPTLHPSAQTVLGSFLVTELGKTVKNTYRGCSGPSSLFLTLSWTSSNFAVLCGGWKTNYSWSRWTPQTASTEQTDTTPPPLQHNFSRSVHINLADYRPLLLMDCCNQILKIKHVEERLNNLPVDRRLS